MLILCEVDVEMRLRTVYKVKFLSVLIFCSCIACVIAEYDLCMLQKKHACGFKCPTYQACKHLWKCAIEQQYFFTYVFVYWHSQILQPPPINFFPD